MLKNIPVSSLVPGMYLHQITSSWLDHSFWKKSFLVDADDIEKIKISGINSVVIDLEKGLTPCNDREAASADIPVSQSVDDRPSDERGLFPVKKRGKSVAAEMEPAKHLLASAGRQMKTVFHQFRSDKVVSTAKLMPLADAIGASVIRNPHALASMVRLKQHDTYTHMHSVAVCALMVGLAVELGLDDQAIRIAGAAGLMHDLGKAFMPLSVLNKPAQLTREEYEIAKQHPQDGWNLLQLGDIHSGVLDVILHHHEKFDGSGYPDQLAGNQISLLARMAAVCDVYDAVTSDRPYKKAWAPANALVDMTTWDDHFDKEVLVAFARYMGVYPVGSLVRLKSGYLAVVLDQNRDSPSRPIVKKFFSLNSDQPIYPEVLNLAKARNADQIEQAEDSHEWNLPRLNDHWLNHRDI
jgi:HD-GYP domain-containing protein (c-di-GMP phosphodiesterase class II)